MGKVDRLPFNEWVAYIKQETQKNRILTPDDYTTKYHTTFEKPVTNTKIYGTNR